MNPIITELRRRVAELEAALQDKCHGLPESDFVAFCDGCDGFQLSQFGKSRTAELRAEIERLVEARDKLQRFKDWVHSFLDAKSVPHHPPGTHGAEGCRIGDRMDYVFGDIERLRADAERLDWLEQHPHAIVPYASGEDGSFPHWHFKQPDGFLSKGHENTLRAAIDAARAAGGER